MCRFIAYTGCELLLANVLIKPEDSLLRQSRLAKESTTLTNGDGFGVGWYVPKISPNPAVFLSIFPAWNDENLLHLTNKIESHLFFAHVRAASTGGVSHLNCHPFIHKNWMFMHNGQIHDFSSIKRHLRNLLGDEIYNWIRGETDSEHIFALFLELSKAKDLNKLSDVAQILLDTFKTIQNLINQFGTQGPSYYNICLTDGKRIVASRYCTEKVTEPESLHYLEGKYFWSEQEYLEKFKSKQRPSVLIASERLTHFSHQWQTVPANHMILVDSDYSVQIQPIKSI
ncbi:MULTISPECIES: class II glutamine amidotransferase [Legionella]|uniref:Glutamine amidotransferase n=1 Tax=Legionella steelei TaxID=947033 RepID=A0A0W0ZDN7_9GAMM|nr:MULTISPECIES: class II glutamine amidotransferase [Legionella]KTD66883.1 glutamine amidotransferase [Legionella steelei]MBN9227381.1 class II glutamine amidotransferase [Legionella steelei]OJW16555.1 MAG: class II glutamine amidotransferase [Legionella sp. 39-23]